MNDRNRFDRFTVRARKVLGLAQEEAQRFQHNYIGTEHLLLGLISEGGGVAAKVLSNLGVELNKVRDAVEANIGRGDRIVLGEIGLTPRAKKVIELAVNEAQRMNHHYIGTEHLLLGLVREVEGIAGSVLESMGVTLEKARTEMIRVLSQSGIPQKKEGGQGSGEEDTVSTLQPLQDDDDKVQELSQEEKDFIGTLGVFSQQKLGALSQDDRDRFDKFTVRARRVLRFSWEEARRFQHNYIGTEHLLLGLVRENGGIAAAVLHNLGVEINKVRSAVEFIIGRGDRSVPGTLGLTPRIKKVIELASDEARRLNHDYIGTEHLLLGLVREGEGIGAGVLQSLGVSLEKVRTKTLKALNQQKNS